MRKHIPLLSILIVYFFVGSLFAIYTPDWQAPDEPAHYNYIRQLAAGNLPVIEPGDYDQDYIVTVVFEARFDPAYSLEPMEYEDWQPPLYYLLLTPTFLMTDGSLLALRLTSLLIGSGVVIYAFLIAKWVTRREWLGWITAVFVALLPQHIAILSAINNDALAELIIAALLWQLVRLGRSTSGDWEIDKLITDHWLLITGLLLGLGFLTKGTAYLMAPIIGLVILWQFWGDWSAFWQATWRIALPAFLIGALWWGRNIIVYGGFDIIGKAAHDAVVVGQPRTSEWVAQFGVGDTIRRFFQTTFNSFWGQFGWMTVPMPSWVYWPLGVFSGGVLIGLLGNWFMKKGETNGMDDSSQEEKRLPFVPPLQTAVLIGLFVLAVALHVGYNLTFVQHQGRYLFPALVPIGVGVAVGVAVWIRPFARRWPILQFLIPLGLGITFAALDIFALFRFIVPTLAG